MPDIKLFEWLFPLHFLFSCFAIYVDITLVRFFNLIFKYQSMHIRRILDKLQMTVQFIGKSQD